MSTLILYKKTPFLRLLLALIAGIISYKYLMPNWRCLAIASAILFLLLLLWYLLPLSRRYTLRWSQGIVLLLLVATLGAAIIYLADLRNHHQWYGHTYQSGIPVLATIKEPLQEKARSFKTTATISAIYINNRWQPSKGDIILYIGKNTTSPAEEKTSVNHLISLIPGLPFNNIIFRQPLQNIRSSGNPGQFNYAAWCKLHNWYHQAYLPPGSYQILTNRQDCIIQSTLFNARAWVTNVLHKYVKDTDAAAIATALLIGERAELDKDLLTAYSRTGVVHIIAISGLHLGLIYGLLVALLTAGGRLPLRGWWRPLLVLTALWAFTLLAGAQPSVLRSAVMFSFITIGQVIGKQHNIYNNLAASAFCLLAYNPYMLWDIGFQLSYSAVAGIAVLYKTIYHWPGFENRLVLYLWQMTALTLSAQVFTFPILLYHFHQFPYWFLVSNLVAVPLSGIVLYLEIALVMLTWYPSVAGITGVLIEKGITLMNSFVRYMDRMPFALTAGVQLSGMQLLLLYLLICCCTSWILQFHTAGIDTNSRHLANPGHHREKMLSITVIASMLMLSQTWELLKAGRQQRIVIYQVPKTTAIAFVHGRHAYLLGYSQTPSEKIPDPPSAKSSPTGRPSATPFSKWPAETAIQESQRLWRINQTSLLPAQPLTVIHYAGKRLAWIQKGWLPPKQFIPMPVDILVLSNNPKLPLTRVKALFPGAQLVFDSSNPLWIIEKWKKDCDSLHLRFHSVPSDGAFVMEL